MPDGNDKIDDGLLPLAQRIAEGSTVDPEEERQQAPHDSNRAVLNALLDIAAVRASYQNAEASFDPSSDADAHPRHWAHLTILEKIGEGEFGEVYRAHDARLAMDVALKLSPAGIGHSSEALRVQDEARLLAKVRHPNVVRVYGADHKQGRVGLWMDLVHGLTLEELTKSQGFSGKEAALVGIDLCRALAAVHAVGVLHGDIKAHNVIRQDQGQIVLLDFGAGRPLAETPARGYDIIGTPVYMAPEVLEGESRSAASDIYSLGVLLFHLVTNDYPVYAGSRAALIDAHRAGAQKRLRDLRPDLPAGFIEIVERATATDPRQRFGSAGALEAALVQEVSGRPEPLPSAPLARRTPWWIMAVAAASVVTLASTIVSWRSPEPTAVAAPGSVGIVPGRGGVAAPSGSYDIEASFYKMTGTTAEKLTENDRLRLKDRIHLSVQSSASTYLYVVNEDEKEAAYLLFPLPDRRIPNPLPAGKAVRIPDDQDWEVNSVGGEEHFLVFASDDPLVAFEDEFSKLPAPRVGAPTSGARLPPGMLDKLRGVGGLTRVEPPTNVATRFRDLFTTPLAGRETARGLWVRQLTLSNPDPAGSPVTAQPTPPSARQ